MANIYKSNMDKVLSDLKKKIVNEKAVDIMLGKCAQAVLANGLRRAHNEGFSVNNRLIGAYSGKPIYINPKNSPRKFTPEGKFGNSFFKKTKQPHKTKYFRGGYRGFRSFIGKESSKVNLQLTGLTLKTKYQSMKNPNGIGYVIGFMTRKSTIVAEAMEKKYRAKIWGLSEKDKKVCREIVLNYIKGNA